MAIVLFTLDLRTSQAHSLCDRVLTKSKSSTFNIQQHRQTSTVGGAEQKSNTIVLISSASSQHRWTSNTNMPTLSNFYTMQDVSKHNTKDDCWIVIDGKVYDVTQYLDDHPGGDDVIIAATGKDATDDFEDAGHSKSAREQMEEYCIGELDTSSPISTKKNYPEKFEQLTKQYWAVPVAVVGISVVVGILYLRKK